MRTDGRSIVPLFFLLAAGCGVAARLDSQFASRAFYSPPGGGRILLSLSAGGAIEEIAVPIDPDRIPAAARTAIERERPGGRIVSAWRVEGRAGLSYRLAREVLGESIEHEATADGEILRRTVSVPADAPAFATARAASEDADPGGAIETVRYASGPAGSEILVTKMVGGARQVVRLRAEGGGFELVEIRRIVEAEIAVAADAGGRAE